MAEFKKILKLEGKKGYRVIKEEIKKANQENLKSTFREISGLVFEVGFAISIPIAAGAFFGTYLDRKFDLAPKITLSFIFLGVFLGMSNFYQIVRSVYQKSKRGF